MEADVAHTVAPSLSPDLLIEIYRRTMLIARTDERIRSMLMTGAIRFQYYNVRGQEVLAAAAMTALRKDDYLVTTYRGMHDELAKGISLKHLWAEFLGKVTGTCKGKGGPMHVTDPENGIMVTTGIVGSGLPIATGLALASQLKGEDRVTVVCFGDGATNIGGFHEAMNMASVWKLPVIFLCQNNRWGEHTPYADSTSVARIVDRAPGYSMTAVNVDGNDPAAVYTAMKDAADRARAGDGPTLIEGMCYRMQGHSFSSPPSYFTKAFREEAAAADFVPRFRQYLLDIGTEASTLDEIDRAIKEEVDEAVEFAQASDYADVSEIRHDVLATEIAA